MMDKKVIPTWGYHATEEARIFDLPDGEDLPAGWFDSPERVVAEEAKPKRGRKAKAEAEPEADDAPEEADDDGEDSL